MKNSLTRAILTIIILTISIGMYGQSMERGIVKEYRGTQSKQPLSGVELMVKGAPSTISDQSGNFTLRFATLVAGDKIDYSEIYKDGYVIFNKDALEVWRISNNENPFTIVMCKESDFRALKKKFYGIIEKSYKADYERQKQIAEQNAANTLDLEQKLNQLKKEYNEKLGNINTYVELFSRIDRSEMDSIEAESLHYIELGEIDKAISIYEELQISRQIDGQMSKWDSGIEMVSAGNNVINQAKNDLMTLVEKMQKQIGLYEMGGVEYKDKRKVLIENIIPVLYRLNSISDGYYNEILGRMIVERSKWHDWDNRLTDYREAARVPSIAGLITLGSRYEMMAIRHPEFTDSARLQYNKILELCSAEDSVAQEIRHQLIFFPTDIYHAKDGNEYPFGLWGENNSEAYLCGHNTFVSTHLEGDVEMPDEIVYNGQTYPVTAIANFAFGNNRSLHKVKLPKYLKMVSQNAFAHCSMLDTIVAPKCLDEFNSNENYGIVITFPEGNDNIEFLTSRFDEIINRYPDCKKFVGAKNELLKAIGRQSSKLKDKDMSLLAYKYLINNLIEIGDTIAALRYAQENVKLNGIHGELQLGYVYYILRNYDNAYSHFRKAIKTDTPEAFNQMAYVHAYAEYGRQDFKKAHGYIDRAIILSQNDTINLPNFLDSKGELFLIEGKLDEAKRYHEKVLTLAPDFYNTTISVLHEKLSPIQDQSSSEEINDNKQQADNQVNIQKYIDLVQLVAHKEHMLGTLENFRSADYEEILSIGIIALQVMLKNKTPEQLAKYNINYIASAVCWAIRNEMEIRYDWYGIFGPKLSFDTKYTAECDKMGIDSKQLSVVYSIYLNLRDIYHTALDRGFTDSYSDGIIQKQFNLVYEAKELMDDEQRNFVDFLMSRNTSVSDIENRFDFKTIVVALDIIKNVFIANNEPGLGISFTKESTNSDRVTLNNDILQSYLPIVRLVVDNEMRYVKKFGMTLDDEELFSIGVIALQVFLKGKTNEGLAKYNHTLIATALSWAIRNELSIRHDEYSQSKNLLDFSGANVEIARIATYHIAKDIYHHSTSDNSKLSDEIKDIMTCVELAKRKMNKSQADCAEYFFSESSMPADICSRFSVSDIIDMLDVIKHESNGNPNIK